MSQNSTNTNSNTPSSQLVGVLLSANAIISLLNGIKLIQLNGMIPAGWNAQIKVTTPNPDEVDEGNAFSIVASEEVIL